MGRNKKFADDLKTELISAIGKAISEARQGIVNDFLKAGIPQKGLATCNCICTLSESCGSSVSLAGAREQQ